MIERRTVSQCITSDYCKGWNDCVKEIENLLTDETILSLRAVLHGCGTNNKCKCGYFAYDIKNGANFPMISFEQAITNVAKLIVELTEKR